MANEQVKIQLNVESNIKQETQQAQKFRDALKQAADAAGQIKVGTAAPATTPEAVSTITKPSSYKATAQPTRAGTAGSQQAADVAEPAMMARQMSEYNRARGSAGSTGASARDFANQAQGLSGLVRLYATYAANVFAVGAAFRALSTAMDTTNMIKGLDQLGAASGRSLAGLSKQFAAATGGAISLRESIEAVAKTTAAGLSSTDVVRLGTAAQKASAALGVNLTDAVSRLSRGITKLEPELLDELGLFTKIDPAVEKYARSVGKAVNQLSDFERRQAFATAVLEEAEQKFGTIDIDVNVYSKLSATFANLIQSGLELVNKVLTPIIELLSKNPVALATVVAGFGFSILKSALPALKDFNKSLRDLQERSAAQYQSKQKIALANLIDLPKVAEIRKRMDASAEVAFQQYSEAYDKLADKINKRKSAGVQVPTGVEDILKKVPGEVLDPVKAKRELTKVLGRGKESQGLIQDYLKSMQQAAETDARALQQTKQINDLVNQRRSAYTALGSIQQKVSDAYVSNVRRDIAATAAQTASTKGIVVAVSEAFANIKKARIDTKIPLELEQISAAGKKVTQTVQVTQKGLNAFATVGTVAAAGTAVLGAGLGRVIGAAARFLPAIGIATVGLEVLNKFFDTSEKEANKFSEALGVAESAANNVEKTLETLSKRQGKNFYDISSVNAVATAFTDLTKSLEDLAIKGEKLAAARSGFTKFSQQLLSLGTLGLVKTDEKKLADTIVESTIAAFNLARKNGELEEISKRYADIFSLDEETLLKAAEGGPKALNKFLTSELSNSYTNNLEVLSDKALAAARVQQEFANRAQESADKLNNTRQAVQSITKEVDGYLQSLAPTDPFSKIGTALINNSGKIEEALKDSKNGILALSELSKDFKVIALLPPDTQTKLVEANSKVKQLVEDVGISEKALEDLQKQQANAAAEDRQKFDSQIANAKIKLADARSTAQKETQKFAEGLAAQILQAGIEQLEKATKFAKDQAAIITKKTELSILAQAGVDTTKQETDLALRQIGIQEKTIDSQTSLAVSIERLRIETQIANTNAEIDRKTTELSKATTDKEKRGLEEAIAQLKKPLPLLKEAQRLLDEKTLTSVQQVKNLQEQKDLPEITRQALQTGAVGSYISALYSKEIQKGNLAAERISKRLEGEAKQIEVLANQATKSLQQDIQPVQQELDLINQQEQLTGIYNAQANSRKSQLETEIALNKLQQESLGLIANIQKIDLVINDNSKDTETRDKARIQRQRLLNEIGQKTSAFQNQQEAQRLKNIDLAGKKEQELLTYQAEVRKRSLDDRETELGIEQRLFQTISSNLELPAEILALNKQIFDSKRAQLDFDNKIGSIESERAKELAKLKVDEEIITRGIKDRSLLTEDERIKADEIAIRRQKVLDKYAAQEDIAKRLNQAAVIELALNKQLVDEKNRLVRSEESRQLFIELRQQELAAEEKTFEILQKTIQLSPGFIADREKSLALKKLEIDFDVKTGNLRIQQQQQLNNLAIEENRIRSTQVVVDLEGNESGLSGAGQEALILLDEQRARVIALNDIRVQAAQQELDRNKQIIEQTRTLAQEQEVYNKLLERTGAIGESLGLIFTGVKESFDKFAQNIGTFTTTFAQTAIESDKNAKSVSKWAKELDAIKEAEKVNTNIDDAAVLYERRQEAAKELGKATNKQAKDELTNTAKLAGAAKTLFKEKTFAHKAFAAVEKALHIARLAMTIKEMFFDTAATGQKVVNDGIKTSSDVATSGVKGVKAVINAMTELPPPLSFAAGAAMAAVVAGLLSGIGGKGPNMSASSLGMTSEQRQETQGTSLRFNAQTQQNEQYRTGVFGAPDEKTKSIANSLEIIRDNSVVGLDYNDKLLKSFENLSKSISNFAKIAFKITGLVSGSAFGTPQTSISSSGIKGFFGSQTSRDIVDSGIAIKGTIGEILAGGKATLQLYETIQVTKKSSGFLGIGGRTRTWVEENFQGLGDVNKRAQEAFLDVLGYGVDTLTELSMGIYGSTDRLQQALNSVSVDVRASLRNLSGKELEEALNSILGSIIADLSEATFSEMVAAYQEFGEDALQTVTRVLDTNRKIEQALGNLRGDGIALNLDFDVTEALASASGGLDKFLDNVNTFSDKFLTDAEKLAPVQASVNRELARLGLSGIKTRDQFKTLVQQLIQTGQTGTETFVSLLKLSDGFDQIAKAAEEATKTLQDAVQKAYDTRVSELTKLRDEFTGFAKSLRDYSLNLRTGPNAALTPQQQYDLLKQEFLSTRDKAASGDVGAIQRFQSVSDKFLESSKFMFASSSQYITDFNMVLQATETTATFAETQAQIASNTLTEIKNTVGQLITLNETAQEVANGVSGFGSALTDAIAALNANRTAASAATSTAIVDAPVIGGEVVAQIQANAQARIEEASNQARLAAEKLLQAELELAALRQAEADRLAAAEAVPWSYDSGIAGAATGMAFDKGIRKYAQGGVINSMMPFHYSEGLGVMGEAGPEAIMPLKRAPDGNLGVIAVGNQNMAEQLAQLSKQVKELTKVVADGAIMNAEATDRNTNQISQTITDTSTNSQHQIKVFNRTRIV